MAHLYPGQIYRAARLWRDVEHRFWLLVGEFAEIEGRIECVGIELRSFIRQQKAKPSPLAGCYEAYWSGEPVATSAEIDSEAFLRLLRLGVNEVPEIFHYDPLAVEAGAHLEPSMQKPTVLRTGTLRDLPLRTQIDEMRRQLATLVDRSGLPGVESLLDRATPAELPVIEARQERKRKTREAFGARRSRPGRPPKWQRSDLETVAEIYSEAYRAGSNSPTKDVADELMITASVAGKLVMRCRSEGLLGAATPRKAGGIETPDQGTQPPAEHAQDGKA